MQESPNCPGGNRDAQKFSLRPLDGFVSAHCEVCEFRTELRAEMPQTVPAHSARGSTHAVPNVFRVRCGLCTQIVEQPFEDWTAKKPLPAHAGCTSSAADGTFPVFKTQDGGMVMMSLTEMHVLEKSLGWMIDSLNGDAYAKGLSALRGELLKALKKYGGK
jgi:hypothetical protein